MNVTELRKQWVDRIVRIKPAYRTITDSMTCAEPGMTVRIVDIDDEHDNEVLIVTLNMEEFLQRNEKYESTDYYDENGRPTKTAREAGYWERRERVYFAADQDLNEVFGETTLTTLDLEPEEVELLKSILEYTSKTSPALSGTIDPIVDRLT